MENLIITAVVTAVVVFGTYFATKLRERQNRG